jgi:hypothetical protein
MLGCRLYALLLTRSVYTQLALCDARGGAPWCYWSAVDCDGRATVVEVGWRRCCLKNCWECLLFTGARSMGRAVQWNPMKPESELIRLVPLKSSPTCSRHWLHCDLQNVPRKHAKCTAGNYVLTGPRHLGYWLTELIHVVSLTAWSVFPYISVDVLRRSQV